MVKPPGANQLVKELGGEFSSIYEILLCGYIAIVYGGGLPDSRLP